MEKRERQKRRRKKSRKALLKEIMIHELIVITVMIFLAGLYFLLSETGVLSKHTFQRVEDITECEEVKFENLLFTYEIIIDNPITREWDYEMLCIFNTGDVYCFYLLGRDRSKFDYLYLNMRADDTWEMLMDPIYLGHFSAITTQRLNDCVANYDENSGKNISEPPVEYALSNFRKNDRDRLAYDCIIYYEGEMKSWGDEWDEIKSYVGDTYYEGESMRLWDEIKIYEGDIKTMDGIITCMTYDKYGARAIRIFESSWFYDELLKICPF